MPRGLKPFMPGPLQVVVDRTPDGLPKTGLFFDVQGGIIVGRCRNCNFKMELAGKPTVVEINLANRAHMRKSGSAFCQLSVIDV